MSDNESASIIRFDSCETGRQRSLDTEFFEHLP